MPRTRELKAKDHATLLETLKTRFARHPGRHQSMAWVDVAARLVANPARLWSLQEMERTGGEPDVIGQDPRTGEYLFCDCAPESPSGRRSLCYDQEALASRKEHKPGGSAVAMAEAMGVELLDEEEYRALQELEEFDTRTSSWLRTPAEIRSRGGAIYGDRRYGRVFVYHNGAESYYAARGFRGLLRV